MPACTALPGLAGAGLLLLALCAAPAAAREPDAWLTAKVKMSLILSPAVRALSIDVDSDDGRVTLRGRVRGRDERDAAEALARDVDGVREVRNLLQLMPAFRAERVELGDAALRARVAARLEHEPRLARSRIRVKSVDRGVVVLDGDASTLSDHFLALDLTQRTAGVREVRTEVRSPSTFGALELRTRD